MTRHDGLIENNPDDIFTIKHNESLVKDPAYHGTLTDVHATNRDKFYLRPRSRLKEMQDPLVRIKSAKNEH